MKNLYTNGKEYMRIDLYTVNEESGESELNPVIPADLEAFRAICFETLDFNMKKIAQSKADNVVASAKVDVLLVKVINSLSPKATGLTTKEKKIWSNMIALADAGYSDSQKSVDATQGIIDVIALAQTKAIDIAKAKTHEELFGIL